MSATFAAASSQDLRVSAPLLTVVPFSVGFWVFPTQTSSLQRHWFLSDTGTTNNYFGLYQDSTNAWGTVCRAGGTEALALIGTLTTGVWAYVIGRFASTTNRRISVLQFDGSVVHAQSTTVRSPISIDTMALGGGITSTPANYFSGSIAELWYTANDIQANGAQLDDNIVRQLAYGGPFSMPHIAKDVLEYRRLFQSIGSNTNRLGEVYWANNVGPQIWAETNGPIRGPHPPQPYWHQRPGQTKRLLAV